MVRVPVLGCHFFAHLGFFPHCRPSSWRNAPGPRDFSKPLNADFLGHVKIPIQIGIGNKLLAICFVVNYLSSQSRTGTAQNEPGIVLKSSNKGPSSAHGSLGTIGGRAGDQADDEGRRLDGTKRDRGTRALPAALHTCSAPAVRGRRDSHGASGPFCQLHKLLGAATRDLEIFSTKDFQTLHQNLTQYVKEQTSLPPPLPGRQGHQI